MTPLGIFCYRLEISIGADTMKTGCTSALMGCLRGQIAVQFDEHRYEAAGLYENVKEIRRFAAVQAY